MRVGPALQLILTLCLAPLGARADDSGATLLSSFEWSEPQPWFGGLSGLEMSADGREMTAITDRGRLIVADIRRDGRRIADVAIRRSTHLRLQSGRALIGDTVDSEGLAVAPDGSLFISFERVHRVVRYATPAGSAQGLARSPTHRDLPVNAGIEALALDENGRLYAMPEKAFDAAGNIPVLRWSEGAWTQPFTLRGESRFLPVGADFGPDGRLYLLERNFTIFGFRSRVRSWRITDTAAFDERLVLQTDRNTHDNLEGLSAWRDDTGRVRLTMIADDNFMFFQRSEIVEYALPQGLAQAHASR